MITDDRTRDVAKAIELAHYPTSKNVTGSAFMGDAKTFLAALNAAEALVKSASVHPAEFAFHDDALVGGVTSADPAVLSTVGVGHLVFEAQPKAGDGFSIGDSRYEFHHHPVDVFGAIVIGIDLAATVRATVAVINGTQNGVANPSAVATPGATPDEIVLTARDPGEPLIPIQTVSWSKVLSVREQAQANRAKRASGAKASVTSGGGLHSSDDPQRPYSAGPGMMSGGAVVSSGGTVSSGGAVSSSGALSGGTVSSGGA